MPKIDYEALFKISERERLEIREVLLTFLLAGRATVQIAKLAVPFFIVINALCAGPLRELRNVCERHAQAEMSLEGFEDMRITIKVLSPSMTVIDSVSINGPD